VYCVCAGSNGLQRTVVELPTESDDEFDQKMNAAKKQNNAKNNKSNNSNNDNDDDTVNDITANTDTTAATEANKGKGKAKKLSKQTSTVPEVQEPPKQQQSYKPCNHTGDCVPHVHTDDCQPGCNGDVDGCCPCANSDHYCTIYCKCPMTCFKRFRGCNCGTGQCGTKVNNSLLITCIHCC
jgi:hypothetical protein